MNKFQHKLLSLTIVCALSMFFSQFHLINQLNEAREINNRQRLEIIIYKDELKKSQEKNGYTLDENQNSK